MKKYFTIIAALFAIAAVSCQKETATPENDKAGDSQVVEPSAPAGDGVVFTAHMPESPVSRTVIGAPVAGQYAPLWTDTDTIRVNNVMSTNTTLDGGGSTSASARFYVGGVSAPYVAIYPGNKLGNITQPAANQYRFLVSGASSPQVYRAGTYDPKGAIMAAYSDGSEDLTFHHLCSYYKITVDAGSPDADNIRWIYIRQGDGSYLAGYWVAEYTDADNISFTPDVLSSAIALDCGDAGVPHGTAMFVSVPAYNFDNGLIITLKDVNGHFASYTMASGKTQFATNPGTVVEFNPSFAPGSGTINNASDWEAFAAAMNSNNDFDRYRWVGNGTVKLGADISVDDDLTRVSNFNYTFDGQDHTITRDPATTNLFAHIYGSVSNLTLAGSLSASGQTAPLAFDLKNGGSISGCTNEMSISFNGAAHAYVGGLVCQMVGGTISGCTNAGDIEVAVDNSTADHNIAVGGIVSFIQPEAADVTLENCTNSGLITVTPKSAADASFGAKVNGVGGIVGWLRGTTHKFTLDNCDNTNTADITISADDIDAANTEGFKKYACCLGGIIGIGSDINTSYGALSTPDGSNGLKVSLTDCDNSGDLTNCYAISSNGTGSNMRIFTGGIAGSLMGNSDDYIELDNCRNTGDIMTYNLTGSGAATTPGLTQVAGGLVGYGGYLDISNGSWVVCTIGDRKRAAFSYAGLIGTALRPFSVDNTTAFVTMNMTRLAGNNCNSGLVASITGRVTLNSGSGSTLSPAPEFGAGWSAISLTDGNGTLASIHISNSHLGGSLVYTKTDIAAGNFGNTDDKSSAASSTMALNLTRLIRGNYCDDFTDPEKPKTVNITTTPGSVSVSGNVYQSSDPTPAP